MGGRLPQRGAELWRRLRASGFTGSLRAVGESATRRQRGERVPEGSPGKVPSARILSRLMTTGRDNQTKAEAVLVAMIEAEVPTLDEARFLLSRFQAMIRERRRPDLDTWIEAAARSLLSSFARGLLKDKSGVATAVTQPWSNGQTEGVDHPPDTCRSPCRLSRTMRSFLSSDQCRRWPVSTTSRRCSRRALYV